MGHFQGWGPHLGILRERQAPGQHPCSVLPLSFEVSSPLGIHVVWIGLTTPPPQTPGARVWCQSGQSLGFISPNSAVWTIQSDDLRCVLDLWEEETLFLRQLALGMILAWGCWGATFYRGLPRHTLRKGDRREKDLMIRFGLLDPAMPDCKLVNSFCCLCQFALGFWPWKVKEVWLTQTSRGDKLQESKVGGLSTFSEEQESDRKYSKLSP